MSMSSIGELIPNSDIIIVRTPPNNDLDCNVTVMTVPIRPDGAIFTFYEDTNDSSGQTWIFNTQTEGEYRIKADTPQEGQQYCGDIQDDTQYLLFTVAIPAVEPITQVQTLGETEPAGVDCNQVGVEIVASHLMVSVNGETLPIPSLTHVVNKQRDEQLPILIVADDAQYGTNITTSNQTVPFMTSVYASGTYQDVVVTLGVLPNVYEYDFGEGYQPLNKYHYGTEGLKTIYVKDLYGCIKTVQYNSQILPDIEPEGYPSTFYISKGNSFRFVDRTDPDFNNCTNYKTDENTYDCELEHLDTDWNYIQKFTRCQDIKTQFKSTFDTFVASLYDAEGTFVQDLPITMVQENLLYTSQLPYLRQDDASFSYIYFANGEIPWFYQVGGWITVNGERQQIQAFEYLPSLDIQAVQIQLLIVGLGGTADYTYNKQPYNVYEFNCPLTTMASGAYFMEIVATTDDLEYTYITPAFQLEQGYPNTIDIFYYSDSNTDIYYGGDPQFTNQITIGLQSRSPAVQLELEVINGDLRNFLKKSFNMEKFNYKFEPLDLEIMRKLVYALANDRLFINSVGYACESVEIEVPNPETNLYVINAVMFKADKNIKFIATGDTQFDFSSGIVTFDSGTITWDRTTY